MKRPVMSDLLFELFSEEIPARMQAQADAAVQGFLKSAGLASLDQTRIDTDKKGGQFYVAVIERKGAATLDVLAEILPQVIRNFPWPKSMRWGAASAEPNSLRWVRPLHSIVATF